MLPYRYPACRWRTLNPQLDPLLTVWRHAQRPCEGRHPRWSEIDGRLWMPFRRRLILVLVRDGPRADPPYCLALFPLAAELLGLPEGFQGTGWASRAQAERIGSLTLDVAAAQAAASGPIPPGPRAAERDGMLKAVAVPLAPEPDGPIAHDRPVLIAVAWPDPRRRDPF